jgi:hypothetical protein
MLNDKDNKPMLKQRTLRKHCVLSQLSTLITLLRFAYEQEQRFEAWGEQ